MMQQTKLTNLNALQLIPSIRRADDNYNKIEKIYFFKKNSLHL